MDQQALHSIANTQWYLSLLRDDKQILVNFLDGFGKQQTASYTYAGHTTCSSCFRPNTCIHIQLLRELGKTVQEHSAPIFEAATDIQKEKRKSDRLVKLRHAYTELQLWLEDIFSKGLAATIQENPAFAQGIAVRMADASLGTLSRRLYELETVTYHALTHNEPLPLLWADLIYLMQAAQKIDSIPDALLADLTQSSGINLRKEDLLLQGTRFKDHFTAVGIDYQEIEPRLKQRVTWLYAEQKAACFSKIEYKIEGVQDFSPLVKAGFSFEAEAILYPGAQQQRIQLVDIPEQASKKQINMRVLDHFDAATAHFANDVKKLPWHSSSPMIIEAIYPVFDQKLKKWYLIDAKHNQIQLLTEHDSLAETLAVYCAAAPITCFGLYKYQGFKVLSVLFGGHFVYINPSFNE
jgi:hypothetical protein